MLWFTAQAGPTLGARLPSGELIISQWPRQNNAIAIALLISSAKSKIGFLFGREHEQLRDPRSGQGLDTLLKHADARILTLGQTGNPITENLANYPNQPEQRHIHSKRHNGDTLGRAHLPPTSVVRRAPEPGPSSPSSTA